MFSWMIYKMVVGIVIVVVCRIIRVVTQVSSDMNNSCVCCNKTADLNRI